MNTRALAAVAAALALSGVWAGIAQARDQLGYVTNEQAGTVTQVDLVTGTAGAPIKVGSEPVAIAIAPNGAMAYVADYGSSQIVPIVLATGQAEAPITLSAAPNAIAITPDGRTAYVIADNGREWPITLATGQVGKPTRIPANSDAIAILPSGGTAYFTNVADGTLTPFTLGSNSVGRPINLSSATPDAVAITPDGSTAYIASNGAGTITPLDLSSGASGTPIALGAGTRPTSIAITPDGSTAYVTDFGTGQVTPVTLATGTVGTPIKVGGQPSAIAVVPAGGITAAPRPACGAVKLDTTRLGNQRLTLKVTPKQIADARACCSSGPIVAVRLQRRTLRHAAKLSFRYVRFTLGKQKKRSTRFPATARFKLRGLHKGKHTITVRAFFTESLARASHSGGHKLTVTLRKTLTAAVNVC